jgi:hypothetical protein
MTARPPRRSVRRSGGDGAGLSRRALLTTSGGLLAAGIGGLTGSNAYTSASVARGSSLPVADDGEGLIGVTLADSIDVDRSERLAVLTNRFEQAATLTVSTATPAVTLTLGSDTGTTVGTTVAAAESIDLTAVVDSGSPAVGDRLTFEVVARTEGTTVTVSRAVGVAESGGAEPIAYWPFDAIDRGRTPDVVGGRDLTTVGNVRVGQGIVGGAAEFRGNSSLERTGGVLNDLSAFTLSVWVNSDRTGYDGGIVFGGRPNNKDDVLGLRYDREGAYAPRDSQPFDVVKASVRVGSEALQFESEAGLQIKGWQHLVLTWASGEPLRLYADGAPVEALFLGYDGGRPATGDFPTGLTTGNDRLLVGRGAKREQWDGRIDDLRLYDSRFSDAEVAALYRETAR